MAVASVAHAPGGDAHVDQLYAETRELRLQGFLLFLISDCVLFSSFIFAYLYLRNSGQGWPPPGIKHLDVALPPGTPSCCLDPARRCTTP
jgi:heme/copper-type cytochrome/quinol oxidase subunit 3